MMEESKFIGLAEPDISTTLDHVVDIIGHGYVPGFEADKTHIPAHEIECEDHAQDDGPWYVVESDKNEDLNIGGEAQI